MPPPAVVAPPPVAAAPPLKPKEPETPSLTLLGTIVNGDDGYAIFMDQASRKPVRVRVGNAHEGKSADTATASGGNNDRASVFMVELMGYGGGDGPAAGGQQPDTKSDKRQQ